MLFITVTYVNTRYIKFSRMKQNEQYCPPKEERVTGHFVLELLSTAHRVSYVTGAELLIHFHPISTPDVMELMGKRHFTFDTVHTPNPHPYSLLCICTAWSWVKKVLGSVNSAYT